MNYLNHLSADLLFIVLQLVSNERDGNDEEHRIYWKCEQKCRKYTQRLSYFIIFHTSIFPIVLIYALFCIASGNYDTSKWNLAVYVVVPYDQTSVWGWFLTWFIILFMACAYALCMTTITSLFVSCCYYIYAMCDHFSVLINSVSLTVEQMQTQVTKSKIRKLRQQMHNQLCDMIKLQVKIYE